jgi:hypothetical protein
MINIAGCEPYEATYDVSAKSIQHLLSDGEIESFATSLSRTCPGGTLMLFDGLLGPPFDSGLLYSVLVSLRACLVAIYQDPAVALCTPVKAEQRDRGFPLHADLFTKKRLFIVFDDVEAEGGGESLFLNTESMFAILATDVVPGAAKTRIRRLLKGQLAIDSFDELYDLLHGSHAWVPHLEKSLQTSQHVLFLKRGQGYLLDDRRWLHGRNASRIPVRAARFRRFVF